MVVAVIDGQGGGVGKSIVEKLKVAMPDIKILALGTNSAATGQMLRAGADEGATGENAIVYNMKHVDIVCGVVAILSANAMMGELSPKMAEAIGASDARKVLIPLNRCHINIVSIDQTLNLSQHIDNAVNTIKNIINDNKGTAC